MLSLIIDAIVLIALLKIFNDDDVGFGSAFAVALVTAIVTAVLAIGLSSVMGFAGTIVAGVTVAIVLAIAVSVLYGIEFKKAFLIGQAFMLAHVGVGAVWQFMFTT